MESHLVDLIRFDVTEAQLGETRDRYARLDINAKGGYEEVRVAIAHLRSARTAVEKKRKDLKADVLDRGRNIDAVAKHFTGLIEAIETPLLTAKKAIDDAEEIAKREQERADLIALDARLTAEREAAEAAAKVEREAEGLRLAVERERLAVEKIQQEEANRVAAEAQRAEQAKIDVQRLELRKQQEAIDAANKEAERLEAAQLRREKAERDRLAAEEAARVEAARLEAIRPEVDKVHAYADQIVALAGVCPVLESAECRGAVEWAAKAIAKTAIGLKTFKGKTTP